MEMLSYIIVGSGYRAEYFGRIARTYPDRFRAIFLCRSEEKVAKMKEKTGIDATTSIYECEKFKADFVVVAVDYSSLVDVCEQWVNKGYPIALETPAGANLEQINRLWELHKKGAKIVVFEQYHRYPILANGLKEIKDGKIGTPYNAYLTLVHEYHAASLLRRMLLVDNETFVIRGECYHTPVVATDSRNEAITDGRKYIEDRSIVSITYASGKTAIYDFCGVQYHSFIRSRHILVRGEKGELNDSILYYLDEDNQPKREHIMASIPSKYANLDTQDLREIRKTWQPEVFLDKVQDEFAIASMLYDMKEFIINGKEVYPLREALDDAYFTILMKEAQEKPWTNIHSKVMPWNK